MDTHAFIWWDIEPARLSPEARSACADLENSLHPSVASIWELQIKIQLGKFEIGGSLAEILAEQQSNGLLIEGVSVDDILGLAALPMIHRDPFDRLLVAQARHGGYHLVSHDPEIARYDVTVLW